MPSLNEQTNPVAQTGGLTGKAYWRSLDELADSPKFRQYAEQEFASYAPELIKSPTRRSFMKLMSASMALAGVASLQGCRRWPEKVIAPYAEPPVGAIPGLPQPYATAYDLGGFARPLLVSAFDGRPIKVEGNPGHPMVKGSTDAFSQATVLEMWDPARSRFVLNNGVKKSWADFEAVAKSIASSGGAGVAVLSESSSSPTFADMRKRLSAALPKVSWFEYEPINRDNELLGAQLAFGQPVRTHYQLENADIIVVLDGDPLGDHPASLKHARDWAKNRRSADQKKMSRMYVVEPSFTITGTNADRRLPRRRQDIPAIVAEIESGHSNDAAVQALISDLKGASGRAVVIVGEAQPASVHAAAHRINAALGAVGKTVVYTEEPQASNGPRVTQLKQLVDGMNSGAVKTLVIIGGNPVYTAPADLEFSKAMTKVETTIHLSNYVDETSKAATWHLPRAHYLESWGDARSYDGTVSIQQPLILPLYGGKSPIEVLALISGDSAKDGYEILRRNWSGISDKNTFEKSWRKALHDGFVSNVKLNAANVTAKPAAGNSSDGASLGAGEGAVEIVLRADYSMYDGRFAPNAWLQEFPDPITKLSWDNAAIIDPNTADKLGLSHGDRITIEAGGRRMKCAVYILPGGAPGSVTVALGYGRTAAENIGTDVGFDAYQIRTTTAPWGYRGASIKKMGGSYTLATTQDHWAIDELGKAERERRSQWLVREISLSEMDHAEEAVAHKLHPGIHHVPTQEQGNKTIPLQIWDEPQRFDLGQQWGMAIDLTACIGCGACMIACQAENNIPVVGKEYVQRGREMHWIRVDRYFRGDPRKPEEVGAVHQPVACQHCETAPCESVCPVAATTHDSEGLNVMVYNRCVGTRYCSNNCPYKVRRFNWFDWNWKDPRKGDLSGFYPGIPDQQQLEIDPIRQLGFNPEVTVRMRGVMEKCTFCVQRIKAVTIRARNDNRVVKDGEITPACAQTCPTEAIVFGNLNDPNARVTKAHQSHRAYQMLRELNTRPRNHYLARVTNSGAAAAGHHQAETHHG
jgi:molybdopterin-containing oxidoreductase family iron-sulfur binding subunit